MKEITYHKEGDYLIPNLAVKGTDSDYHIGLYGRLRLEYIKKHRLGLYNDLILDLGQVFRHIFLRIFINYSSFAGAVDINIKENL